MFSRATDFAMKCNTCLVITAVLGSAGMAEGEMRERWSVRYGGVPNREDGGSAVAEDRDGNVVVAGRSSNGFNLDFYAAKYAAIDGTLLWERRFSPGADDDKPYFIATDAVGGVVVSGVSETPAGTEFLTIKYAADGAQLWFRMTGRAGDDQPTGMALDGAGNVIVTGSRPGGSAPDPDLADYYTVKYAAADGTTLWEKFYNGPARRDDVPGSIAVDGQDNVIVAGVSINAADGHDGLIVKYAASDGTEMWVARIVRQAFLLPSVAVGPSGDVAVTASWFNANVVNYDLYTAKLGAANGAILWEKTFNGPAISDDYSRAVAMDAEGNVFVGATSLDLGYDGDFLTLKYAAADGEIVWPKRFDGPSNSTDEVRSLALDPAGNPVVAGHSRKDGFLDYYAAKYSAAKGDLLWEARYDGPQHGDDQVQGRSSLALTADGGAVMTGQSAAVGAPPDMATVRFFDPGDADGDGLPDAWEIAQFGSPESHSASDDSDGDTMNELMELAFGGDPRVPDVGKIPPVLLEDGRLTVTLTKRLGVVLGAEAGNGPAAMSTAATEVVTDNATALTMRDRVTSAAGRFLRVRVTPSNLPPP